MPASSGISELAELSSTGRNDLSLIIDKLKKKYDTIIFDSPPGISSLALYFQTIASKNVVVMSPEPTSIVDAYALIKVSSVKLGRKKFNLVVNKASTPDESIGAFNQIKAGTDNFLDVELSYAGYLLSDDDVKKSVVVHKPVCELKPDSPTSKLLYGISHKLHH